MSELKFKRQQAINFIIGEYPTVYKWPQDSLDFQQLIINTCAREMVSRRTAREYVLTAIAKIKIKQANDEMFKTSEE